MPRNGPRVGASAGRKAGLSSASPGWFKPGRHIAHRPRQGGQGITRQHQRPHLNTTRPSTSPMSLYMKLRDSTLEPLRATACDHTRWDHDHTTCLAHHCGAT